MSYQEIIYTVTGLVLVVSAATDILFYRIQTLVVLCPVPVILFLLHDSGVNVWKSVLLGLVVAGSFMLLSYVSRGQIGMGDGLILGVVAMGITFWQLLALLFLAFSISGIYGIFLVLVRKKTRKYKIPFVPFVLVGYLLTIGGGYL